MAISFPSVCVPRVTMHSDTSDVERVFNSIFGGDYVDHVDMTETVDSKGQCFQVMFVHFKQGLPVNKWTTLFYQKLENDKMVKVMTGYKEFYWKVYYNQSSKKDQSRKNVPHIMTAEEEANLVVEKALKVEATKSVDLPATEEDVVLSECD